MPITKLTKDLNIVQSLPDKPRAEEGYPSELIKEKFDEAGNEIKSYINDTLTKEIDENLATREELKDVVLGQIPESALDTEGGIVSYDTYSMQMAEIGKVKYVQNTEPVSKDTGLTWFNPDTGLLYISNGTRYIPVPPVQVLQEVIDFTESNLYIKHNNTIVEDGEIKLQPRTEGTIAARTEDITTMTVSDKRGLEITLNNTDLEGVKGIISGQTSGTTKAYLYSSLNYTPENLIGSADITGLAAGETFEIYGELKANSKYYLVLDAEGQQYSSGARGLSGEYPFNSTYINITNGVQGTNTSTNSYGILSVQALISATDKKSGFATVEITDIDKIKAWDLATYQNNLDGGTVTVDIEEDIGLIDGTTVTAPVDNTTLNGETEKRGFQLKPNKADLRGIKVTISAYTSGLTKAYLYNKTKNKMIATKDISGLNAGDSFIIEADFEESSYYSILGDNDGGPYDQGRSTPGYVINSEDIQMYKGANSLTGTDYSYGYNFSSITPLRYGWQEKYKNIPQNFDISPIDPSKQVRFKVNLSRESAANNPGCDYLARRYVR